MAVGSAEVATTIVGSAAEATGSDQSSPEEALFRRTVVRGGLQKMNTENLRVRPSAEGGGQSSWKDVDEKRKKANEPSDQPMLVGEAGVIRIYGVA